MTTVDYPARYAQVPPPPPVGSWKTPVREQWPEISLRELGDRYQIVDTRGGAVVVTDRIDPGSEADAAIRLAENKVRIDNEIGASGTSQFAASLREEYNPLMVGDQFIAKCIEMRNDGTVRASLRVAKTPVLGARWFVEPAGPTDLDKYIAEFVWKNLVQWMSQSWPELLTEILFMLDYGRYSFEKVYTYKDVLGPDGNQEKYVIWQKFSPRHPIEEVEWVYDPKGGPKALKLKADNNTGFVTIPIEKLAVFIFDKEAGDMRGFSVLRSAYKHWFYKENLYKIDAIQKERHGIGVPIIKLPVGFTETDSRLAQAIGQTLRTNERAHVVLPPFWEIMFAKLEGQPVNALESAQHHALMLYHNVLAHFLVQTGNTEENRTNQDMFVKSTRFIADIVRDIFNKYCIPQLIDFNWDIAAMEATGEVSGYPEMRVRRIGDTIDHRILSFAMRNYAGMGALIPDEPLETWLRDEMDLPVRDPDTVRMIGPQNAAGDIGTGDQPLPPEAPVPDLPAQSKAGNQRIAPKGNSGQDKSGTSSTRPRGDAA